MRTIKLSIFAIAVAGLLLVAAPKARACCVEVYEAWIILGFESSSGDPVLGTEVKKCMKGIAALQGRGFSLRDVSQVRDDISVLLFDKPGRKGPGDNVSLFCYAVINQFDEDSPL